MSKKNCLNCVYFENYFCNREVLISRNCSKHKPKQPLLKIINESRTRGFCNKCGSSLVGCNKKCLNNECEMSKKNQIPSEILDGFQEVANKYSNSPATTDAGRVLRFLVKILPVKLVAQIFSEKFK